MSYRGIGRIVTRQGASFIALCALVVGTVESGAAEPGAAVPEPERSNMPAAENQSASVGVLPLRFEGVFVPVDQQVLNERLALGLKSSGLRVVAGDTVQALLGARRAKCGARCSQRVSGGLGVRYLAGGEVKGVHDTFNISLWLADGLSGKILVESKKRCTICGITELGGTMDLAASVLRVKVQAVNEHSAEIAVRTDPVNATISLNDKAIGSAPRSLTLSAGRYALSATAPGYEPATKEVVAVASTRQEVMLKLTRSNYWRRIGAWSAIGLGAGALTAGVVLLAIDGQAAQCHSGASARREICKSVRDTGTGGFVSLGAGVAAVATGLYLLFTGDESSAAQPESGATASEARAQRSLRFVPSMTAEGTSFDLIGTF